MAKKALINLVVGDKVIERGKIYKNEDVADLDPTTFEEVSDEALADAQVKTGVAGAAEVEESVKPEMDTQTEELNADGSKKEEVSGTSSNSGDVNIPEGYVPHTLTQEDLDNDTDRKYADKQVGDIVHVAPLSNFEKGV